MKLPIKVTYVLLSGWLVVSACGGSSPSPASNAAARGSGQLSPMPATASSPGALPDSAYRVEWVDSQLPSTMSAGETTTASVTLRNSGDAAWPSATAHGSSANNVYVSYHWLSAEGNQILVRDGLWSWLPKDVAPGESFTLGELPVKALDSPGAYRLELTLVHENVTWFEQKGANTLIVPVTIE